MQINATDKEMFKYNHDTGSMVTNLNSKYDKTKRFLDGPMNKEEIKMNKQLLNEISQAKKKLGENYESSHNSPAK